MLTNRKIEMTQEVQQVVDRIKRDLLEQRRNFAAARNPHLEMLTPSETKQRIQSQLARSVL